MSLPLTAHHLLEIRRRAPGFDIREDGPGTCRASLGRAWIVLTHHREASWQQTGPWQIVGDAKTLEDQRALRRIVLREIMGKS
jgi:hypothetical protein